MGKFPEQAAREYIEFLYSKFQIHLINQQIPVLLLLRFIPGFHFFCWIYNQIWWPFDIFVPRFGSSELICDHPKYSFVIKDRLDECWIIFLSLFHRFVRVLRNGLFCDLDRAEDSRDLFSSLFPSIFIANVLVELAICCWRLTYLPLMRKLFFMS